MHDAPLPLTKDLAAALAEILGATLDRYDPVVVLAFYIDALAREYGLSESLSLDADPIERTAQAEHFMNVIEHFLADESTLDADVVRARVYNAAATLAGDPQTRRLLNLNRPMTETDVMRAVQIYWNLEATTERPRLPLKPDRVRDIPVPGTVDGDFATMRWTARTNLKGSYKTSGQGFRKQGARLAAVIARHLAAQVSPAPAPHEALAMAPTRDPAQPVEITLKALVEERAGAGAYDDAFALSTSYLDIITRRAAEQPFNLEADLAEAFLMKGFLSGAVPQGAWSSGQRGSGTVEDLEKAAASFETQVLLNPDNDDLVANAATSWHLLGETYLSEGRPGDGVGAFRKGAAYAERRTAVEPHDHGRRVLLVGALLGARKALKAAGRFGEAVATARRTVAAAEQFMAIAPEAGKASRLEVDPTTFVSKALLDLAESLRDVGLYNDSEQVAHRVLALGPESKVAAFTPRVYLDVAATRAAAGNPSAAADAMEIVVAYYDNTPPIDPHTHLGALFILADYYHDADRLDEGYATDRRAIEMYGSVLLTDEVYVHRLELSVLRCAEKLITDGAFDAALALLQILKNGE